jgi:hypothetical protein
VLSQWPYLRDSNLKVVAVPVCVVLVQPYQQWVIVSTLDEILDGVEVTDGPLELQDPAAQHTHKHSSPGCQHAVMQSIRMSKRASAAASCQCAVQTQSCTWWVTPGGTGLCWIATRAVAVL